MADSVVEKVVEEVSKVIAENTTKNGTATTPSTPEGIALAYVSLMVMAVIPVFLGSFRSITHQEQQKAAGEPIDTVTSKDAAMFPLIASCALFTLYIVFTMFSKDYVNMLLGAYFFFLGIFAMSHVFSPVLSKLLPRSVPLHNYQLSLTKDASADGKTNSEQLIFYAFTTHDCVSLVICTLIGIWYLMKKHWIANNLMGLAFAINGIELLNLNSVVTGALLLWLLFIYDIFWVFGTNVMVTVAKSFEAPIKLVFPQDILEKGLSASNFAMLGLGDIVIPGIFIALLLRFDKSLNRGTHSYFYASFIAYFLGLLTTILVLHFFKHAQPALLYLVPFCVGFPTILALIKGDIKEFYAYEGTPSEEKAITDATEKAITDATSKETTDPSEDDGSTKRVTRGDAKKEK